MNRILKTLIIAFSATAISCGSALSDTTETPLPIISAIQNTPLIDGGGYHTLALNSQGFLYAWGWDNTEQLGDGTIGDGTRAYPDLVVGQGGPGTLKEIVAISTGLNHSLALTRDGSVYAWGFDGSGQLGDDDGSPASRAHPELVVGQGGPGTLTDIIAISAGSLHSIALTRDGRVYAWGYDNNGQLGDGTINPDRAYPELVVGQGGPGTLTDIIAISAGNNHSMALTRDGRVYAWGQDDHGQLGDDDGSTASRAHPELVVGQGGPGTLLTDIVAISAGTGHSIALTRDGRVYAWGQDNYGQLGDGNATPDRAHPELVVGPGNTGTLTDIIAISAGSVHNLALTRDGRVYAWGFDTNGQLGDGTINPNRAYPELVVGPGGPGTLTDIVRISIGNLHSLALTHDGRVYAWGHDNHGQLGDGTIDPDRPYPVLVVGPGNSGILNLYE